MSDESTTTENTKPTITLQDIASVVEVLKVCTERGVWRVQELSGVGRLYDRLTAFLESTGVSVSATEQPQEEIKE